MSLAKEFSQPGILIGEPVHYLLQASQHACSIDMAHKSLRRGEGGGGGGSL